MSKWLLHLFCVLCISLVFPSLVLAADQPPVANILDQYESTRNSAVLGVDSTFFMGYMTRNGFGFPKLSIGISTGLDIRRFTNLPSLWTVQDAERKLLSSKPELKGEALFEEVAEAVNPGHFNYIQFGTEDVLNPKIGVGTFVPFNKSYKNNVYIDIGVSYPRLINLGILYSF